MQACAFRLKIAVAIAATNIRPETDRQCCPEPQHYCDHTGEDHGGGNAVRPACLEMGDFSGGEERSNEEAKRPPVDVLVGLDWAAALVTCVFPMIPMTVTSSPAIQNAC